MQTIEQLTKTHSPGMHASLEQLASSLGALSVNPSGRPPSRRFAPAGSAQRAPEDERLLLAAISKICALQKQYGKTAAELETLLDGYLWLLDDVPTAEILLAMKHYANRHNDIPTPADIRNIIEPPPPEPEPLSTSLYVKYQKMARDGHYLMKDERDYCRAYEAQEMAKARGGSEELRGAQAEIGQYGRQLMLDYDGGEA